MQTASTVTVAEWSHLLLPVRLGASPTPLVAAQNWLLEALDEAPQPQVATVAFLIGALFLSAGACLIKPIFITSCASCCGLQVDVLCKGAGHPAVARWAPAVATVVAVPSMKLWSLAYPGFVFLVGCAGGGSTLFVAATSLTTHITPASTLGATVMAALIVGLTFLRCHDVWWRLLTPGAGALLAAASLRYFAISLTSAEARWLDFTGELARGITASLSASAAVFWTGWAILTVLGWYLQIGPLIGLRKRNPVLPPWVAQHFPWLVGPLERGDTARLPSDTSQASLKYTAPYQAAREPLLSGQDFGRPAQDTDQQVGFAAVPKFVTMGKDMGLDFLKEDHRPEVALLVAVLSVISLNGFLANQPPLFLGHAVLMSTAFLPLATAGMVSYASTSLLLPGLFGSTRGIMFRRHLSHGAFNGFALACALGGYACIYAQHKQTGASQLGLDQLRDPARIMHVWIGYTILGLLFLQSFSGVAKLYAVALAKQSRWLSHHVMGRLVYCLAALNQLIAYTFPGLMPVWATPLLAAMLMVTVGSTLFFLQERARLLEASQQLEGRRYHVGKSASEDLPNDGSSRHGRSNRGTHVDSSAAALAAAERALEKNHNTALMQRTFAEWHRDVQRQRLEDAVEVMEGQDRLVQFLSAEMVESGVLPR